MKNYQNCGNGHVIRLNKGRLPAHREDSPGFRREMRTQEFGIYRPLTEASLRRLGGATIDVVGEALTELTIERGGPEMVAPFDVKSSMATTFVDRRDIGKNRLEMLRTGFRIRHEMDAIHDMLAKPQERSLTVGLDLDHFEWTDRGDRSLAVFYDTTSDGYDVLLQEQEIIARLLGEYSVKLAEVVRRPNHITLLKYGKSGDKLDLSKGHKNKIIDAITDKFVEERLYSADLASLHFGKSYDEPIKLWSATVERANSRFGNVS